MLNVIILHYMWAPLLQKYYYQLHTYPFVNLLSLKGANRLLLIGALCRRGWTCIKSSETLPLTRNRSVTGIFCLVPWPLYSEIDFTIFPCRWRLYQVSSNIYHWPIPYPCIRCLYWDQSCAYGDYKTFISLCLRVCNTVSVRIVLVIAV